MAVIKTAMVLGKFSTLLVVGTYISKYVWHYFFHDN